MVVNTVFIDWLLGASRYVLYYGGQPLTHADISARRGLLEAHNIAYLSPNKDGLTFNILSKLYDYKDNTGSLNIRYKNCYYFSNNKILKIRFVIFTHGG